MVSRDEKGAELTRQRKASHNMSESPYAPPKAVVADVDSRGPPGARPWQVGRAMACLWVAFGINIANSLWTLLVQPPPQVALMNPIFLAIMYALGFLLAAWIYFSAGKGRNWARIIVLIFSALSLLGLPFVAYQVNAGAATLVAAIAAVVIACLKAYLAYLLLTSEAREWYRSMKGRA